jgi:two-component system, LytTR family, sensor kinase
MMLQPLVENSIKHGLARKVGGHDHDPGATRRETAVIEVEDDGLGISDERLPTAMSSGIGLSNVNERLRVIYGARAASPCAGSPGRGARARLEIPDSRGAEEAGMT